MTRRQKAIAFFVTLCVLLVAAAISLNVGLDRLITRPRRCAPVIFGIVLFALIIAGLIVYTVFLVLEIRRNEEHDSFINAVTHELKTPIASIRLYLETLQSRHGQRGAAAPVLRHHAGRRHRLHQTVDQVLKAGAAREKPTRRGRTAPVDMAAMARECVDARARPAPPSARRHRARCRTTGAADGHGATRRSCGQSSPICSTTR